MRLSSWNKYTNHLIDWDRVGNLLFTSHRYSNHEIMQRAFVICATVLGGYLGWNRKEGNKGVSITLGLVCGFVASHAVVISPLVWKRLQMKWACDDLCHKIKQKVVDDDMDCAHVIDAVIGEILNHEQSTSSQTWGSRKRLLTTLLRWLNNPDLQDNLVELLSDNKILERINKNNTSIVLDTPHPRLS